MLSKVYFKLKDKIEQIEAKLANNLLKQQGDLDSPRLFYFGLVLQNFELITLEIVSDLVKYCIILFSDPSQSFAVLYKQKAQHSCPHSYTTYKVIQKKIRTFSTAGMVSMVAVAIVTSLITNLIFGGKLPTYAATFGWTQTDWSGGASTTASVLHPGTQYGGNGWSYFLSKDANLVAVNGGADLQLAPIATTSTWTTDTDFNTGTKTDVVVSGTGNEASLKLGKEFVQLAGGASHSLALKNDGTVWAWGLNSSGQLGDGTVIQKNTPVQVAGLTDITAITAGYWASAALKSDGTVWAWGYGGLGQLGDGTAIQRNAPVQVSGLNGIIAITFGQNHAVALKSDGTVWAWGYNWAGQLGDGTTIQRNSPIQVSGLSGITAVTAGLDTIFALKSDGTVWALGYNNVGQLGINTTTNSSIPVQVLGLTGINAIATGYSHSLAIKSDGTVWSWGYNISGQLGDGTTINRGIPIQVSGLTEIVAINGGQDHSVALKNDGTVMAWGLNTSGQLGDGTVTQRKTPVQVSGLTGVSAIDDGGHNHSMAIKNDGTVWAWGYNNYGQLGDDTLIQQNTPVQTRNSSTPADYFLVGNVYKTTGTFTSQALNTEQKNNYTTLSYNQNLVANTNITVDMRFGNTTDADDGSWTAWQTGISSGENIAPQSGNQYIQYRLNFSSNGYATPQFNDIAVNYAYYPASQSLVSSAYNSNDAGNLIGGVTWQETPAVATGTAVIMYLRSASSSVALSSATWLPVATSSEAGVTPGCTRNGVTGRVSCDVNTIDGSFKDGSDDQWFQYRLALTSDGQYTPTVGDAGTVYVVNAPPEVQITNVLSQNSDATVAVNYQIRDWDSSSGKTPGSVVVGLQYCSGNCLASGSEIWITASSSALSGQFGTTTVDLATSTNYLSYSLTWNPKADPVSNNLYHSSSSGFKIRLVADDSEAANSKGYGQSNIFESDAKTPIISPIRLDASTQVGNIIPSNIYFNTTDDTASTSGLWMYLTENDSLDRAGALALGNGDGKTGWAPYTSTTTWQLSDWRSTIHVWFKDAYQNVSTATTTPPIPPTELMISDISNPGDENYRLFFSWKKIVAPDFAKYNIWRATSSVLCGDSDYNCLSDLYFTLLASTTDYMENSYTDTGLASTTRYYYKVTTESDVSNNYNISRYASIINGKPDGNGASSDATKPIISRIAVTATSTQAATIQWNTNETSKSLVHYLTEAQFASNTQDIADCAGGSGDSAACERIGTTTADLFINATSIGINGFSDNDEAVGKFGPHIVNLNKLEPGTNYYFQVTSRDPSGNESKEYQQVVNGTTTPLTFQTKPGPKIDSGPNESGPTNTAMTISWHTTLPADSAVIYSTDYDGSNHLVTPIETKGSLSLTQDHEVRLTGLLPDTDYYYYIMSTDPDDNYAMDDNTLGGATRYFSFRTSFDQTPPSLNSEPHCQPVVTDRNGSHQLVITSSTTEPAILDFDFGTTSDSLIQSIASTTYFDALASTSIYDANQTIKQGNLTASTTYYFRYTFYDNSDNASTTGIFSCNTIEPMVAKSEYDLMEQQYLLASTTLIGKIPEDEVSLRIASSAAVMLTEASSSDPSDATSTSWVNWARLINDPINRWVSSSTAVKMVAEALAGMIKENSIIDRIASTSEELKVDNNATSTDSLATTWVKKAREAWVSEDQAKTREEAARAAGTAAGKSSAGSSIIVIDKTDKVAPIISEVKAENITATSAVVSWVTNEEGDSLVEYVESSKEQGESIGQRALIKEHSSYIKYLLPATSYSYVVSSADSSGNLAKSSSFSFTTPELTADELLGLGSSTEAANINPETVQTAATKLMALLGGLSKIVSLGTLETTLSTQYDALDKIAGIIPAPILSGEPAVEITPTTATIRWHTDKAANSLIGYVPEAVYVSSRGDAAYTQTVGKSDELKSDHEVKIYNLKPETTYHFQLSSKAQFGPKATSKDFSFKTRPEALEITTYSVNVVSPTKAIFKWITSAQTNSQTKITPYRGSKLMVDEAKLYLDKTPTTNHETLIDNLIAGVIYNVSLSGVDQKGTRIEKVISSFSTTKDDLPPEITQIQTESALSQGKTIGVQTVIAWQTNEPTSCSIKYALGSKQEEKDLVDTTPAETGYSGKHSLVITKFKPGEVYSFRVYCLDSGDNQTISGTHTILTPKQRESVFDLIVRTMEQTFGWMGNVSK